MSFAFTKARVGFIRFVCGGAVELFLFGLCRGPKLYTFLYPTAVTLHTHADAHTDTVQLHPTRGLSIAALAVAHCSAPAAHHRVVRTLHVPADTAQAVTEACAVVQQV